MSAAPVSGRLSTLAAALVIARRDFTAILFSRSFFFFLLGPLFPLIVGGLAGGIGASVKETTARPELGIAMSKADVAAMSAAYHQLQSRLVYLPDLVVVDELQPGEAFDAGAAVGNRKLNLAAVITGTPEKPVLTGTRDLIERWQGPVSLAAAQALGNAPATYPNVELSNLATKTTADENRSRVMTAQLGQTVLFLLTMLLAGMVLSNLVEEKGNKIIEILAAAIPMDAVFLGKLFAMLAVSWVGISVWGVTGTAVWLAAGNSLADYPAPAVGWPMFFALGVLYFSMGYLLLGSLFLAIGSMASTVREVQTLSMPVTMLQLLNFFFASYAMAKPGTMIEIAATIVPFSSPFAMLARAAQDPRLWTHGLALAWQVICVAVFVKAGATLFRKWVMKSGPARSGPKRRWFGQSFGRGTTAEKAV
ncbi:ABC transporter permease [Novosphingobium sp.]|uniref:ABC transporter permease n=1 Tax=Novosphingobium sp. TaxID=1874826 RepID=UPI0027367AF4|nr:ABC transporter permease [Novosphingobium sp.]MDP3906442.1 ABC transporter permease [Novosphingobium sp.]